MRICYESSASDVTNGEDVLLHLKKRRIEVVRFGADTGASGMIAEISGADPSVRDHALVAAHDYSLPVLALSRRSGGEPIPDVIADHPDIRVVQYSGLIVARVAIDVFLEAHCGYRVPLGADDQENHGEGSSKLF